MNDNKWRAMRDGGGDTECAFRCDSGTKESGNRDGIHIARLFKSLIKNRPALAVVEIQNDGLVFFYVQDSDDKERAVSLALDIKNMTCGTHTILTVLAQCDDAGMETDLRYEVPEAVGEALAGMSRTLSEVLRVPFGGGLLWE